MDIGLRRRALAELAAVHPLLRCRVGEGHSPGGGDPARLLLASQRVRSEAEVVALGAWPTIAVSNVSRIPRH